MSRTHDVLTVYHCDAYCFTQQELQMLATDSDAVVSTSDHNGEPVTYYIRLNERFPLLNDEFTGSLVPLY